MHGDGPRRPDRHHDGETATVCRMALVLLATSVAADRFPIEGIRVDEPDSAIIVPPEWSIPGIPSAK